MLLPDGVYEEGNWLLGNEAVVKVAKLSARACSARVSASLAAILRALPPSVDFAADMNRGTIAVKKIAASTIVINSSTKVKPRPPRRADVAWLPRGPYQPCLFIFLLQVGTLLPRLYRRRLTQA